MSKNKKTGQLNIRISDSQKSAIAKKANDSGYKSISKFLIDYTLDQVKVNEEENKQIFVVSLTASIDYFIQTKKFGETESGDKNSGDDNFIFAPGGRGINLSRILKALNISNTNINIGGGFTGNELFRMMEESGIKQHRIPSNKHTKLNVFSDDHDCMNEAFTEKNVESLASFHKEEIRKYLSENMNPGDILVMSGSLSIHDIDEINAILRMAQELGVLIYINTPTPYFSKVIEGVSPELIILCEANFEGKVISKKDIFKSLQKVKMMNCKNIAFIADINNALFVDYNNNQYTVSSKLVDRKTYTGLEDAFIAGYIANIGRNVYERLMWSGAAVRSKVDEIIDIKFESIVNYLDEIIVDKQN